MVLARIRSNFHSRTACRFGEFCYLLIEAKGIGLTRPGNAPIARNQLLADLLGVGARKVEYRVDDEAMVDLWMIVEGLEHPVTGLPVEI
jgi:hypothetical protein